MILNQFIYPLESQESIIKMTGGNSMRIPYKQRLFLSTNLDKDKIIDDAFRRRLLYQIYISPPSKEQYANIFKIEAEKRGITDNSKIKDLGEKLILWYKDGKYALINCNPRNLFTMIDAMCDENEDINNLFTEKNLREVFDRYPKNLEK